MGRRKSIFCIYHHMVNWLQKLASMSSTTKMPALTEGTKLGAGASESHPGYLDCPVERDVLGRHSWTLLHTIAANVPDNPTRREQRELSQFMTTLSKFYPCQYCADDFRN